MLRERGSATSPALHPQPGAWSGRAWRSCPYARCTPSPWVFIKCIRCVLIRLRAGPDAVLQGGVSSRSRSRLWSAGAQDMLRDCVFLNGTSSMLPFTQTQLFGKAQHFSDRRRVKYQAKRNFLCAGQAGATGANAATGAQGTAGGTGSTGASPQVRALTRALHQVLKRELCRAMMGSVQQCRHVHGNMHLGRGHLRSTACTC